MISMDLNQSKLIFFSLISRIAGLFTWHPILQSFAIIGFSEGILLLQPVAKNSATKKKGRQVHQIFQLTAFPISELSELILSRKEHD